jgi:hypothetical protein
MSWRIDEMNKYEQAKRRALAAYYANPSYCKDCGSVITVKEWEQPRVARHKQFCNSSCAAKFNNKKFPKRKKHANTCKLCGEFVPKPRRVCDDCLQVTQVLLKQTKGELLDILGGSQTLLRARISNHARRYYQGEFECKICSYNKHVEICHKKPVSSFPLSALIRDINAPANLVALCATHHRELDLKLMDQEDLAKL